MNEGAAQRRAAWETVIGLAGVLAATQIAGASMLATVAGSALFTIGIAAFAHAGATILKGLRRTTRGQDREDEP
jgi:hypothetical protein